VNGRSRACLLLVAFLAVYALMAIADQPALAAALTGCYWLGALSRTRRGQGIGWWFFRRYASRPGLEPHRCQAGWPHWGDGPCWHFHPEPRPGKCGCGVAISAHSRPEPGLPWYSCELRCNCGLPRGHNGYGDSCRPRMVLPSSRGVPVYVPELEASVGTVYPGAPPSLSGDLGHSWADYPDG